MKIIPTPKLSNDKALPFYERLRLTVECKRFRKLTAVQARLFIVLLRFANWRTCELYPSLRTLEKLVGTSRSRICRALKVLERRRFIETVAQGGQHQHRRRSTVRRLTSPKSSNLKAASREDREGRNFEETGFEAVSQRDAGAVSQTRPRLVPRRDSGVAPRWAPQTTQRTNKRNIKTTTTDRATRSVGDSYPVDSGGPERDNSNLIEKLKLMYGISGPEEPWEEKEVPAEEEVTQEYHELGITARRAAKFVRRDRGYAMACLLKILQGLRRANDAKAYAIGMFNKADKNQIEFDSEDLEAEELEGYDREMWQEAIRLATPSIRRVKRSRARSAP